MKDGRFVELACVCTLRAVGKKMYKYAAQDKCLKASMTCRQVIVSIHNDLRFGF